MKAKLSLEKVFELRTYEDNLGAVGRSEDPVWREDGGTAVMLVYLALDAHLPGERVRRGLKVVCEYFAFKKH